MGHHPKRCPVVYIVRSAKKCYSHLNAKQGSCNAMYAVEFNAKILDGKIEVPMEYLRTLVSDVKVIMLYETPPNSHVKQSDSENKSIKGIISKYANPELIPLEKTAWEEAVKEKHAIN